MRVSASTALRRLDRFSPSFVSFAFFVGFVSSLQAKRPAGIGGDCRTLLACAALARFKKAPFYVRHRNFQMEARAGLTLAPRKGGLAPRAGAG